MRGCRDKDPQSGSRWEFARATVLADTRLGMAKHSGSREGKAKFLSITCSRRGGEVLTCHREKPPEEWREVGMRRFWNLWWCWCKRERIFVRACISLNVALADRVGVLLQHSSTIIGTCMYLGMLS